MSTAVCCSHSPFTCGKAETQRSRVCASCTFKATNEKKQNECLLTPGMNSVELLAKALFSRNTPQIYPLGQELDHHPAFVLPPQLKGDVTPHLPGPELGIALSER